VPETVDPKKKKRQEVSLSLNATCRRRSRTREGKRYRYSDSDGEDLTRSGGSFSKEQEGVGDLRVGSSLKMPGKTMCAECCLHYVRMSALVEPGGGPEMK